MTGMWASVLSGEILYILYIPHAEMWQALQVYSWLFLELCTEPQMTWKCHTSPTSVGLPFPWFVYLPCRPLWPMKVAPSIVRQVYSCLFLELCAGFAQLWKQYTCLWGQAIKPGTETVKRKRNETKRNETKRNETKPETTPYISIIGARAQRAAWRKVIFCTCAF